MKLKVTNHVENDSECAAFLTYWKSVIWTTSTCGEQENASEEEARKERRQKTRMTNRRWNIYRSIRSFDNPVVRRSKTDTTISRLAHFNQLKENAVIAIAVAVARVVITILIRIADSLNLPGSCLRMVTLCKSEYDQNRVRVDNTVVDRTRLISTLLAALHFYASAIMIMIMIIIII
ncbi:hypothetical protein T08_705 [Trichinella sp. T8]|nr:hypothetical protein T08_705 [Trichinella sp. T8]